MKNMLRLMTLAVAFVLAFSGCGMFSIDRAEASDEVLAEFKGGKVLLSEAQGEYDQVLAYYSDYGYTLDDPEAIAAIQDEIILYLAENKIAEAKAKELGLYDLSDEEKSALTEAAKQEYAETLDYYKAYFETGEEGQDEESALEEVKAFLAEQGYTEEIAVADALNGAWQQKLYDYATKDATATDDQINVAYEQAVAADQESFEQDPYNFEYAALSGSDIYWYPEGYRAVKHILIPFTDEQVEALSEKSAELDDVIFQIEDLDAAESDEAFDFEDTGLDDEDFIEEDDGTDEMGEQVDWDEGVLSEEEQEAFAQEAQDSETDEADEEQTVGDAQEFEVLMEPEDAPDEDATDITTMSREQLEVEKERLSKELEAMKSEYAATIQERVDEVMARVNAGEDFDALIAEYGEDLGMTEEPGKSKGYYVSATSEMWEKVFSDTAMSLEKVGDVSQPVVGTNGVHIIKYFADVPAGAVSLEDVRDVIMESALDESRSAAYDEALETWKREANIMTYRDRWVINAAQQAEPAA